MAAGRWIVFLSIFHSLIFITIFAERKCPDQRFGWKCEFSCNCKDGENCNEKTGACDAGCAEGFYGEHCLLKDEFYYDSLGVKYFGSYNKTAFGEPCESWKDPVASQVLSFKPENFKEDKEVPGSVCRYPDNTKSFFTRARSGPWCLNKDLVYESCGLLKGNCHTLRYGDNCIYECHCEDTSENCNKVTGRCTSGCHDGWIGQPGCQTRCKDGTYGPACRGTCGKCRNNKICDFVAGRCPNDLCKAGFFTPKCDKECNLGFYGENCVHRCGECQLNDGESCDKVTGLCPNLCKAGFKGARCTEGCDFGTWGQNCSFTCGSCQDKQACRNTDGVCVNGCKLGWYEPLCDQECNPGTFGKNCSGACGHCKNGEPCNLMTGECEMGCTTGYEGTLCKTFAQGDVPESSPVGIIVAILVVLIICIVVVIGVLMWRRRRFSKTMEVNGNNEKGRSPRKEESYEGTDEKDKLLVAENGQTSPEVENGDEATEPIYVNVNTKKQSMPVMVDDLSNYIKTNKQNECEGFKKEFGQLPHGLMALCEVAKKPENRPKNRYGNIIAYDHSRVVLEPVESEMGSDYINANYIDGYTRPSAYIASQGATKVMTRDFWRMVWQKKVCKIVMLTNLMEACKKKCEQYWPDTGTTKYGSITVELVDCSVFTDFTIRTLKLAHNEASRIVKQFHFTSWSDHGALTYPTPLLTFKRKVQMYNPESTAPVVVHCSAGIGRSGTYIALDYLLQQAKAEGLVDVLRCAQLMRANRINMIQTWEQYVFVYEALLEALKSGETTISQSAFRAIYDDHCTLLSDKTTTTLEDQFQILQSITHGVDNEEYKAALLPENLVKNRVKNVLPANRCRPHLYTQVEGCNDYINAIFLPGYTRRDSFIVTQMPLPNTVADFWRMLYDYSSHTVVMLNDFDRNDKTCALYWPEEYGYTVEYDPLSIELLSSTEVDPNVSTRVFKLCNTMKGEERAVKQFQLKSWPDYQNVPNSTAALLQLYDHVQEWINQNGKGPVTVHCMNGASKSGLFCAVSLMFERMQRDHEIDVFQTAMTMRTSRPQFIESLEQYQFCYQMALEALDRQ